MILVPHRKHMCGSPRPVTGIISLYFYNYRKARRHLRYLKRVGRETRCNNRRNIDADTAMWRQPVHLLPFQRTKRPLSQKMEAKSLWAAAGSVGTSDLSGGKDESWEDQIGSDQEVRFLLGRKAMEMVIGAKHLCSPFPSIHRLMMNWKCSAT
jgi:hypothetical protein